MPTILENKNISSIKKKKRNSLKCRISMWISRKILKYKGNTKRNFLENCFLQNLGRCNTCIKQIKRHLVNYFIFRSEEVKLPLFPCVFPKKKYQQYEKIRIFLLKKRIESLLNAEVLNDYREIHEILKYEGNHERNKTQFSKILKWKITYFWCDKKKKRSACFL